VVTQRSEPLPELANVGRWISTLTDMRRPFDLVGGMFYYLTLCVFTDCYWVSVKNWPATYHRDG
jgi:hypothetical protein